MENKNGKTMPEKTPLKSIRQFCFRCCNGQPAEIRKCPAVKCAFYPYRMGKKMKPGSVLKAIRARCRDCGDGTAQAIRGCEHENCPVFYYRLGKNPVKQAKHRIMYQKQKNPDFIRQKFLKTAS